MLCNLHVLIKICLLSLTYLCSVSARISAIKVFGVIKKKEKVFTFVLLRRNFPVSCFKLSPLNRMAFFIMSSLLFLQGKVITFGWFCKNNLFKTIASVYMKPLEAPGVWQLFSSRGWVRGGRERTRNCNHSPGLPLKELWERGCIADSVQALCEDSLGEI